MKSKNIYYPYTDATSMTEIDSNINLIDHLTGFDSELNNSVLAHLNTCTNTNNYKIFYHNILEKTVIEKYPNLKIQFSAGLQDSLNFSNFKNYNQHPGIDFKNFVCSFNGSEHVSRKLLVGTLKRFNFFNKEYSSKNIAFSADTLYGHVSSLISDEHEIYTKFIVDYNAEEFYNTLYSFKYTRFNHRQNIRVLENKLTESFLHIVSETMATSYYPFVTEKFLYSIVTRGLFLAYAQPGWHTHLEKYYGFKLYTKLFDYRFDAIQNPIERLVELMSMISKFSVLSTTDWHDLYLLQQDEIEYNYNHYYSGNYLTCLKKYEQ
jgi:hypothetical protein